MLGSLSSCDHQWKKISEHATRGDMFTGEMHTQHKCAKCGTVELCNQDHVSNEFNLCLLPGNGNWRNQCSKCGCPNDGWSQ